MRPTPRVCLDANCLISGIASPGGATGRIVRNIAIGRLRLALSPEIESEYFEIAQRPSVVRLFARHGVAVSDYVEVLRDLCAEAETVVPTGEAPACRDEKDRKDPHCAASAHVDYLISRDADLLDLESVDAIPIVDPDRFLTTLQQLGELLDR